MKKYTIFFLACIAAVFFDTAEGQDNLLKPQADLLTIEEIDGETVMKLSGHVVISQANFTLKSDSGLFYKDRNWYVFKGDVSFYDGVKNLNASEVECDNNKRIFYFYRGIELISGGKNLTADKGIYYKDENKAFCEGNVIFRDSVNTFKCDSAYFLEKEDYIHAFGNLAFDSRNEDISVMGEEGIYYGEREFIEITEKPKMTIKGDESEVVVLSRKLEMMPNESQVKAYGNVEILKEDLTALCDTAVYLPDSGETKILLKGNSRIIDRTSTITGEPIEIYFKDKKMSRLAAYNNAVATMKTDSLSGSYNRLKGKAIYINVSGNVLEKMTAERNAEIVYYLTENGKLQIANKSIGEKITLEFSGGEIQRALVDGESESTIYPPHLLKMMNNDK